jgi:putative nucleotidyltransferase with HDIG domain
MGQAGGETFAASPTELRRYLGHSVLATFVIAGLPLVLVFSLGSRLGAIATVISMAVSIGLAQLGNALWQRHPGSKDVVFNDLMLWGYFRRVRSRKGLSKKVERLGIGSGKLEGRALSIDEQTRLLKRLAIALESGDPYTHGHSQRVARHSYMIAKAMKLPRAEREKIRLAAIVHDVGKLRIPKDIINKPGALTDAQYDIIKTHSLVGAKMVSILDDPELTQMVRQHHERLDGSGYPDKVLGKDICLGARIIAVADTFDATSSQRPYRAAQPHKVSIDILKSEAGRKLDARVVNAFVDYYSGKRSFKWWAFAAVVPAHLRDLSILLAQRVGATGLANAAVVGATAVALTPGPAAAPVVKFDGARQRPAVVAASAEQSRTRHGAPDDAVLGDKLGKPNKKSKGHGKKKGHERHVAAFGKDRDRGRGGGRDEDKSNGNGNGNGNGGHGNGHGPTTIPGDAGAGSIQEPKPPKEEKPDKPDKPTDSGHSLPPGQEPTEPSGSDTSSGSGSSGNNGNGNGNGGGKKDEPTDPGSGSGGPGSGSGDPDSGSGGSGSGDSGSGSGDSGGSDPAPEEPTGPGNSGNAPGQDKDKGGSGGGNGNGGGKDK